MRKLIAALMLSVGLTAAAGLGSSLFARAEEPSPPPAPPQMELTETLLQQYLASLADVDAVMAQAPQAQSDTPDPKTSAKLEEAVKKHKFTNFDQFETVVGNIALVLQGVDPKSKKYIGPEAELKQQIAELQANKNISADDKKSELAELNEEMKAITPVKFKNNISLVLKYYDKLTTEELPKP